VERSDPTPQRPVLVYDRDCSFCWRWVQRWRSATGEQIEYAPYQEAAPRFGKVQPDAFKRAVHLIEPDGRVSRGAEAVFRSLALSHVKRWPWWAYRFVPLFAPISERAYRFIADHRNGLDRLDGWLMGWHTEASSYFLSRWLFLRALGVVYLIAFTSLWVQVHGLIGSRGILPIANLLQMLRDYPAQKYWMLPTLCWINASDGMLTFLCASGVVLSVLLIVAIAPAIALLLLWANYLSLVVAGQVFLGFQWDSLLLESGFAALFLAPWTILPGLRRERRPPMVGIWLQRWLLFRVMFMSGVVKLASGDPTWRDCSALRYHYQTQPLTTWTAWYVHQLPAWFGSLSCWFMFMAELIVPFLMFGPRRVRLVAFWGIISFQALILATGNYGFFNLLTIALCFTLPDDVFWKRIVRLRVPYERIALPPRWRWRTVVGAPVVLLIALITLAHTIEAFRVRAIVPDSLLMLQSYVDPFRSINSYGLFAVMTTRRPEIIVEGSDDGVTWKAYAFKWKPGEDLTRRPAFCTPHMPRLDWQLWFAALSNAREDWVVNFMIRLLQNEPSVVSLLEANPFGKRAPRYVRAVLYDYRFTTVAERRASSGAWWRRVRLGLYCPPISLQDPNQPSGRNRSMRTDFDALWNYDDPAGTETKFRALLPEARASDDPAYELELLTQIARTFSLRRKFDEAHALLDEVERRIKPDTPAVVRVRYLLERGRAFNSSGNPQQARPLFIDSFELAHKGGLDDYAVDALHMIAIVETDPATQLDWNFRAMKLAESSPDPKARRWLASLYNNVGWTYYEQKRYAEALDVFQKAVPLREQMGNPTRLRIAHYSVGKTLRAMGRVDEALTIQLAQHDDARKHQSQDGFVCEEIGECLLLKNQSEEAKPYLRQAYAILCKDEWLVQHEPKRIERLRELTTE
jgi:predicted DCC family thiol-disulfide oxidoreductase YuxK/tetratricopeptide (TPR) repeat protein